MASASLFRSMEIPTGGRSCFIHGLLGSRLNWQKQVSSPELQQYRIITYDLRGHGLSSKPVAAAYYQDGARWGRELKTVIAAAHLRHPVLVGWSMGGVVLTNYLHLYGDKDVAGIVYADAVIVPKAGFAGIPADTAGDLSAADLFTYLRGTRKFVRNCFYIPPAASDSVMLNGAAAMASPDMLRAVSQGITVPAESTLPLVKVPVLIVYGEQDILVLPKTIMLARRLMPAAQILRYPKTGHSPFFEQPKRFNRDLDNFLAGLRLKATGGGAGQTARRPAGSRTAREASGG